MSDVLTSVCLIGACTTLFRLSNLFCIPLSLTIYTRMVQETERVIVKVIAGMRMGPAPATPANRFEAAGTALDASQILS